MPTKLLPLPRPISRREVGALVLATVAVFLANAALARHGLGFSDEGYIIYPAVQVAEGLVPYRDINSLYAPLTWYLHAALFKLTDVGLIPLRIFFSAVIAALSAGVYLLARQYVAPGFAAIALLSFALLFPRVWIPYPAWYALGGLLVALLALNRWLWGDRRARWLVVVGAGCALAFGAKPNLGLFALLTFCGFLVLRARSLTPEAVSVEERRTGWWPLVAVAQAGFLLATVAAFWLLIGRLATPGNQVLLLVPVAAAGLLALEHPRLPARFWPLVRALVGRCALIVGTFLALTLPWYVALSMAAGWELVFDTLFRAGARTAAAFYTPVILPNRDAVESLLWIVAGVVGAIALATARRSGFLRGRSTAVLLVGSALAAGALLMWRAIASGQSLPAYLTANLTTRLQRTAHEEGDFLVYVPFLALWGGLALLAWARWRRDAPGLDPLMLRISLLVWFLALFIFQVYPKVSILHILFSIGPFLVLVEVLRAVVWTRITPAFARPGVRLAIGALLLVWPLLFLPGRVRTVTDLLAEPKMVDLPRAGVWTNFNDATQLALAVERFAATLQPGDPIFAYPAIPMVYVLTEHPNPTRESYLPAGYVDEERQRAAIAQLEATRTRYVVWDQELIDRWGLWASDRVLVDYIWRTYRPVAVERAWLLLERIDQPPAS